MDRLMMLLLSLLDLHLTHGQEYMTESMYGVPYSWDSCPQLQTDLLDTRVVLSNMRNGILEELCGGDGHWNCTKVVVYSNGMSAVKQPTRFGLFFLHGLTQENKYPSFYRPADGQYLFYLLELGQWEYWHQYERWIIGPTHGVAHGGIMIRPYNSEKRCPWHIKWFRSHSFYYDQRRTNLWNSEGNPWVPDDSIRIECYDEKRWPEFDCGCDKINVTSSGRVLEYSPDRLGEYVRLQGKAKEGYQAPVYAKSYGAPSYLYSHDILGRVWLMGSSTHSWSLRLNLLDSENLPECPFYPRPESEEESEDYYEDGSPIPMEKVGWEYLQSKRGENEVWLKDYDLSVTCIN